MKNKKNNMISEADSTGMATGYGQSAGGGVRDALGGSDMIAQPVLNAMPATFAGMGKPGVPATMSASAGMRAAPEQSSDEDSDEEEMEEGGEDEPVETTEETRAQFHDALMSLLGEDVPASLVNQLDAIFEAAVSDRVERKVASIVEEVDENVKNYLDTVTESLVEKVDLDYVVEEWMTDNAVAVEQGIKTQIAENFIGGLKNLFENHYIDVPSEKYNVLDELYAQNRDLENKLNESVKYTMDLRKEVSLTECAGIFVAETRDLADTQISKLQNLMENVNFNTPEEYREKLVAIRENYMNRRPAPVRQTEPEQTFSAVKQTPTTLVESYVGVLGRLNKRV
jgi:hypothetical protein